MSGLNSGRDKVVITGCKHYHPEEVRQGLKEIFKPFGGIEAVINRGQKVLIKPNLLAAVPPAEAVTTHPLIVQVLVEMIQEAGGKVFIGDSPGNDGQELAHRVSGLDEVMKKTGAEMLIFEKIQEVESTISGLKTLPLAAELDEVDLVINVGKLKTHSLTGMTGAVKNLFGCVVGGNKKRFHLEHPLPFDFSRLLLGVSLAVKPAFSVLDAVVGMEGPGPRRGKPRQLGLLMGSPSPVALDTVAAEVLGFSPDQVTTVAAARALKLTGAEQADIDLVGLSIEEAKVADFDRGPAATGKLSWLVALFPVAILRNIFYARRPYPLVNRERCTGCGICREACPTQLIRITDGKASIEHYECIRCYCCHELCPQGAIMLVSSPSN
ncbi:MAG: DUF362 domain-containing protein [Bacillota bacterium]|nr:DUF362 domain-containing protein [Bacillota bacterium]